MATKAGEQNEQASPGRGDESHKARLDRELIELLNELRVALPGVQVLFAFLLTVPFTQRFTSLTDLQRDVYFGTFLSAAAATVLLIAPTSYHRLRWRDFDKERLLRTSTRLTIAGLAFLALAVAGTVYLISDVLFGARWAALFAAALAGAVAWFWYALPLSRKVHDEASDDD